MVGEGEEGGGSREREGERKKGVRSGQGGRGRREREEGGRRGRREEPTPVAISLAPLQHPLLAL